MATGCLRENPGEVQGPSRTASGCTRREQPPFGTTFPPHTPPPHQAPPTSAMYVPDRDFFSFHREGW